MKKFCSSGFFSRNRLMLAQTRGLHLGQYRPSDWDALMKPELTNAHLYHLPEAKIIAFEHDRKLGESFKLALYFSDIFNILGKNWLLTNVQYQKFSMFPSAIANEKAKLHECVLKLAGGLIKQNAEIMLITAKLLELMRRDNLNGAGKFSPKELSDVMASWNIPIAELRSIQIRKTDKLEDNAHDVEKNIKEEFTNFVDKKQMEQALAEAAKYGPYY